MHGATLPSRSIFHTPNNTKEPIPVAARSKAWVCHRSLAGSNPAGVMSAFVLSGRGLWNGPVQRNSTDCSVSEYDREGLIMRRPWPTGGRWAMGGGNNFKILIFEINYKLLKI